MISVVVPTLNEEDYLRETLESVRAQDVEHELIVIDGGSDDDTVEIAEEYADKTEVIGPGVSRGRNRGAEIAEGDILLFLDADTRLVPGSLEEVARIFREHDDVIGVSADVSSDGSLPARMVYKKVSLISLLTSVMGVPLFHGMCMAWRREPFEKVGGFNEEIDVGEDVELCLNIHNLGRCVWNPRIRAVTSSRRVEGSMFWKMPFLHLINFFHIVFGDGSRKGYPVVR